MKRSKWFGLWNNSEEHYMISQPIKIEDLKSFTESDSFRLILKKNKYYKKDDNRPYYCFSIGNCYESANNKISSLDLQYEEIQVVEDKLNKCIDLLKSIANRYEWNELNNVDLWLLINNFLENEIGE